MDGIRRRPYIHGQAQTFDEYEDHEREYGVESEDETESEETENDLDSVGDIKYRRNAGVNRSCYAHLFLESLNAAPRYDEYMSQQHPKANVNDKTSKEKISEVNKFKIKRQVSCFAILCALVLAFIFWKVSPTDVAKTCVEELKMKYPQNKVLLDNLHISINNKLTKTNQKSDVYLFTHYDNHHHNSSDIIKMILKEVSNCLIPHMEPIHMSLQNFKSLEAKHDYGLIIEEFKKKIKKSKVIVVENLNEIPFETARALHVICDTESPVDKDVVVFLTLKVTEKINENGNGLEEAIERILNDMWSNMKDNELHPLITRVTNNVFFLRTELDQ